MTNVCSHGRKICSDCILIDDSAKRAYDTVRLHVQFATWEERVQGEPYVALRLSDGGSDGRRYATKRDAVRAQLHEQQCAYFSFRNAPNGFGSYRDAAIFLAFNRAAYDAGMRLPDPDDAHGGPDLVMPAPAEKLRDQLRRLLTIGLN